MAQEGLEDTRQATITISRDELNFTEAKENILNTPSRTPTITSDDSKESVKDKLDTNIDHNNTTARWLNDNDLSCIVEKCLKNEITLDILIEAELDDIKSMCEDAQIKTQHRLKLQSALKKTKHSRLEDEITQQTQKQEEDLNIEEKCPVINNINVFNVSSEVGSDIDVTNDEDIKDKKHDYRFKILLVGDSAVGKSSIMVRFKQDIFSSVFISTIGVDFAIKKLQIGDKIIKLQVWDTAGQERFRAITSRYYKGTDAVCIVYNITDKSSFENVNWWLSQVRDYASDDVVIYVIGAKNDLEETREVSYDDGQQLCNAEKCEFYEVSAKTGRNIPQLFNAIAVHLLSIAPVKNEKDNQKNENENIVLSARHIKKKKRKCCRK